MEHMKANMEEMAEIRKPAETDSVLKQELAEQFGNALKEEEKSRATIEKYLRDVKRFLHFAEEDRLLTKETVVAYKQHLAESYAIASANSMLAALNAFLRFLGRGDCAVKAFRVQKEGFRAGERELTREEYFRLVEAARRKGNVRLSLILQTLCATGIRISELPFITVESLSSRRALVALKGKRRTVILPMELCRELRSYVRERGIEKGSIFITRSGAPMDRTNIYHAMKALCKDAGVDRKKIFPHNLRHLFAVTYYNVEKDVCRLADLLGHSSVNTTRIYTLVSCEVQEQRVESLGLVLTEHKNTT